MRYTDFSDLPVAVTLIFFDPTDEDGVDKVRFGLSGDAGDAVAWAFLPGETTQQVGWFYRVFGVPFLIGIDDERPYYAKPVWVDLGRPA